MKLDSRSLVPRAFLAAVVVVAGMAGCGTTAGGGGGGGAVSKSDATVDQTGSSSGSSYAWSPMVKGCIVQKCNAQWVACMGNATCGSAINCGFGCGATDAACAAACDKTMRATPAALALADALAACVPICTAPVCGDGVCAADESVATCPADCGNTADATSLDSDAGPDVQVPQVCGDGKCAGAETAQLCHFDCDPKVAGEVVCLNDSCATEMAAADPAGVETFLKCQGDATCLAKAYKLIKGFFVTLQAVYECGDQKGCWAK